MKVDSEDHFLGERKAKKEEMQALVVAGVEVPPKAKKLRVEGRSRLGCALNNYLNMEKQNRTGMSNYYEDYLGRKQGVANMKAPAKCVTCDLGINEVRRSHNTLNKWNRKTGRYHPRRVQPDIHNTQEVCGNNSQEDREKGAWELTSDED